MKFEQKSIEYTNQGRRADRVPRGAAPTLGQLDNRADRVAEAAAAADGGGGGVVFRCIRQGDGAEEGPRSQAD